MTRRYKKIPFKDYHDKQSMLFPPDLDDMVPGGHPVRVVNSIIDKVNSKTRRALGDLFNTESRSVRY